MRPIDKFLKRLEAELGIKLDPDDYRVIRPNRIQKQNGVWSWCIRPKGMGFQYGSQIPIKELLKSKSLHLTSYKNDTGNFYINENGSTD